jgi:hypothetical protein
MPTPVPPPLLRAVQALAREEAVRQGQELTWPALVRAWLTDRLRGEQVGDTGLLAGLQRAE